MWGQKKFGIFLINSFVIFEFLFLFLGFHNHNPKNLNLKKAEYPGVYVPTSYFYDWIKKEVDKNPPIDFEEVFVCKDAQC